MSRPPAQPEGTGDRGGGRYQVHHYVGAEDGPESPEIRGVGERRCARLGAAWRLDPAPARDITVGAELVSGQPSDDAPGHAEDECDDQDRPLVAVQLDLGEAGDCPGTDAGTGQGHYHECSPGAGADEEVKGPGHRQSSHAQDCQGRRQNMPVGCRRPA